MKDELNIRALAATRERRQRPLPWRAFALPAVLAALLLALASCTDELGTLGEPLRLVDARLEPAIVNESYEGVLHAVGGLRPYEFRLADAGALPPGLELRGGVIRGTPESTGQYEFTVTVSDANLQRVDQRYRLAVTEVPLPEITFNVPTTEVREPVTVRAEVRNARSVVGLRALVRYDAELFRLRPDSVTESRRNFALFTNEATGELQVDLAALGGTIDGTQAVFTFVLEPAEPTVVPTNLYLDERVEFQLLTDGAATRHHFVRQAEGRRPPVGGTGASADDGGDDASGDAGSDTAGDLDDDTGSDTGSGAGGSLDGSTDDGTGGAQGVPGGGAGTDGGAGRSAGPDDPAGEDAP